MRVHTFMLEMKQMTLTLRLMASSTGVCEAILEYGRLSALSAILLYMKMEGA